MEYLDNHQAGFTCDQIFILKQLLGKYWEDGKDTHLFFINLAKAYDSIRRSHLWMTLQKSEFHKN